MVNGPLPLFDSVEYIKSTEIEPNLYANFVQADFEHGLAFISCYIGSKGTFNSYRREVERLTSWSWMYAKKSLANLNRYDLEQFICFCQQPPVSWIGIKKVPRFIVKDGIRIPNHDWKPFVVTIAKAEFKQGIRPTIDKFQLSGGAIKEVLAILSSFFNYLIQEDYLHNNPIALLRQKSKFIRKRQYNNKQIKRLSNLQWEFVIATAKKMAEGQPNLHARTYFIMSALYSMYLRISELVETASWVPTMNDFSRDLDGNWWFTTVGKGNKERQIAVSDSMLAALKVWRQHLGLMPLPTMADNSPLLPKLRGKGGITSTTYIRTIIQDCFDLAIEELKKQNLHEDADYLLEATVHWLRHTGISEDVKIRPREHVRDDAGHSSSATTDNYINVEMQERHLSAKGKVIEVSGAKS